ncbi:hypothetical protein AU255_10825 [Methyloprofundus sedimenti]|uniref:Efflux transporter periplasmic adaptor subunit n=1 Tax=Methyloprofundus sedimenti TaxID=1420851 RepID=A0A1V8M9L5_9GAMM|nr:efflux RND transporter periplasmic adaptor subunit [Methyloprofundus sedimenti]OQK18290.1 hypothetical protein AU255_10825 [Methyloprofundus sedimenti]
MKTVIKTSLGLMLSLLLIGIVFFLYNQPTAPPAKQQNFGATYQAGHYQIQIKLNPDKPKIGNNQLTISLRDGKDQAITDANIEAYAEMPAMGSMQAMREPVSIDNSHAGLYQGHYSLPMNGSWPISIAIESPKYGNAKLVFDMNTSRTGVELMQATASELSPQHKQADIPKQQLATFNVDSYRRQLIGVTTTDVVCRKLLKIIRTDARVTYNQSQITDINLKYDAWIGQLNADYLGKTMQQGKTLFTVYSPDLVSAQDEYLDSLKQNYAFGLRKAARRRLALWDINSTQIKALEKRSQAIEYLPITSPVNGTIIEKNLVAGSAVKAGTRLLRLADLSTVWVEGQVYEADLPWIKVGMSAHIILPGHVEQSYTAKVIFVDPILNPQTRSAIIRVQLDNANGLLRPDMFATLSLHIDLGERMVVPEQAVIYSGEQRIVFVDKGHGRLLPVKIKTGLRNDDMIEVLDGLAKGDIIVTSGNFLIAAESKLKSGLAQW